MARLTFLRGEEPLLETRLADGRTVIGRADSCDIVVPGEPVSRVHCLLDRRGDKWILRDRGRHGTWVDGQPVSGEVELRDGALIQIGEQRLRFTTSDIAAEPTASRVVEIPAEQLVAPGAVERAVLTVVAGPDKGRRIELRRARQSVGAKGSDHALSDPALRPRHAVLAVTRGRPILMPGEGPVFLDGERVLAPIPVYPGEELRLGDTALRLDRAVSEEEAAADAFGEMVGSSAAARGVFGVLRRVAAHNAPVLLFGESGTGKELAARGLHEESPRAGGPFVAVNCGAIAEGLFESELFGHEKGAFTGAAARQEGAFLRANGGTLFLDEVGELPEAAQAKLLRALESGEVRRVGGAEPLYPDVRVVAATNRDLEEEVERGRFRADLFFRLAVLAVRLPPLRERLEDLPAIARAIVKKLGPNVTITDDAIAALARHDFPGNARELRNILTRAAVLGGPRIVPASIQLHPWSFDGGGPRRPAAPPPVAAAPPTTLYAARPDAKLDAVERQEKALLEDIYARTQGNRSAMARELGIPRTTVIYKLQKYGLG